MKHFHYNPGQKQQQQIAKKRVCNRRMDQNVTHRSTTLSQVRLLQSDDEIR